MPDSDFQKLITYSSGNGSIGFCWEDAQRNATGRTVTVAEACEYLKSRKQADHLWDSWRVWDDGVNGPVLVTFVERIDEQTLNVNGRPVRYAVNQCDLFYRRNRDVREYALGTWRVDSNGVERALNNLGTRASIMFFLNNEEAMQSNPPIEV